MFILLTFVALLVVATYAIVLPREIPRWFEEGEIVELKVNKMTSTKTLLTMGNYHLPFCQPAGGPKMDDENLGQILAGERIESSPYVLKMKTDMYCEQLCISNLGKGEQEGVSPNKVVRAISQAYHNNWIVDNLPAAARVEDAASLRLEYWQGIPVGYISGVDKKAYIYNHASIEIMYHPAETEAGEYRIVRFIVAPFSINHDFEPIENSIVKSRDGSTFAKIINPIPSCDHTRKSKLRTDYNMIAEKGCEAQLASGKVLFTYDVAWVENLELKWASRWDVYLCMGDAIPDQVYWFSIANSLVVVFLLSGTIATYLLGDFARYNRVAIDEESAEDQRQEIGWKLVQVDVFRPPSFSPFLLAVACGTGAQILCASFLTIIGLVMRFLSPANRGALIMAALSLYVMMGGVAGYVAARLYKTFRGTSRTQATTFTALGFPAIVFCFLFSLNLVTRGQGSSDTVPFTAVVILVVLWLGISTPLVFIGAYFGYKQGAIPFPVKISSIPRQIPHQPWFMSIPFTLAIGGILPFGACFVEVYFILASVWMHQYYSVFGFLLIDFLILIITCGEITILFCYFQLSRENYQWWWRSFCTAGSTALYVFFYSIIYFKQLEVEEDTRVAAFYLYFGYMGLVCFGLFFMTGFIGVASSLVFNKIIFFYSQQKKS